MSEEKTVVCLYQSEGTLLYSDEYIQGAIPSAFLSVAVLQPPLGCPSGQSPPLQIRSYGSMTLQAEAVAAWFAQHPGMREAVDGIYKVIMHQRPTP